MAYDEIVIKEGYGGVDPVSFGYENCTPSHHFGPAVRGYWLLHYVVSGSGVFVREGITHTVKKGEIFVIPPYVETYYEADKTDPWHYVWVGFVADERTASVLCSPVIRLAGVGNIFEDMRRCHDMENGKSAFLCSRIWELISRLQENEKARADYVEKALNYMRSEYMHGINVAQIARRLNLDRSYFTTLFSEKTGMSPGKYLLDLRLKKAEKLMVVYGETVTTAAVSCGFSDVYHFSKAFKQQYGCSPREYCKRQRQ